MTDSNHIVRAINGLVSLLWKIDQMEQTDFDHEYHHRLAEIDHMCPVQERQHWMEYFFAQTAAVLDNGFMHSRTRGKPLGYAGDYLVIDWIYTLKTAQDGIGEHLDRLFHRQTAPKAVRSRKDVFCDVFVDTCTSTRGVIAVLNLASGPGREIAAAVERTGARSTGSFIHCVDMESDAIDYATNVVKPFAQDVTFQMDVANVFRFQAARQYDVVWSAGLFDYLSDRLAVALLRKMWALTKAGGRMIVGNFHPGNPTRICMEWCLNWFLIHRTEEDYIRLCQQAAIPIRCLTFSREPNDAILFCTAAKAVAVGEGHHAASKRTSV